MLKLLQYAALFAAVVLLLSITGIAYYSSPPPRDQGQQQTAGQEESEYQSEGQRTGGGFIRFLFPDSISIFSLLLVIATVALAVLAFVQIGFLNRSEHIAANTAQAAKDSADIAKSNLLIGQRAYVYVSFGHSIVNDIHTKNAVSWRFTPTWTNFGATPTRNLRNHISIKVFDGDIPESWDFPDRWDKRIVPADRKNIVLPLGPHSAMPGQSLDIAMRDMQDAVSGIGTKTIYIWGWAEYDGAFPNTSKHITRFANRILVGGDPTNPDKCTITYPLHHKYNCADDECDAQDYPVSWKAREEAGN